MAAPAAASPHIHARVHGARLHGRVLRTLRMNDIATDNYVDHRECEKRARTGGAVDGVAFGPGVVAWDLWETREIGIHTSLPARSPSEGTLRNHITGDARALIPQT